MIEDPFITIVLPCWKWLFAKRHTPRTPDLPPPSLAAQIIIDSLEKMDESWVVENEHVKSGDISIEHGPNRVCIRDKHMHITRLFSDTDQMRIAQALGMVYEKLKNREALRKVAHLIKQEDQSIQK